MKYDIIVRHTMKSLGGCQYRVGKSLHRMVSLVYEYGNFSIKNR